MLCQLMSQQVGRRSEAAWHMLCNLLLAGCQPIWNQGVGSRSGCVIRWCGAGTQGAAHVMCLASGPAAEILNYIKVGPSLPGCL